MVPKRDMHVAQLGLEDRHKWLTCSQDVAEGSLKKSHHQCSGREQCNAMSQIWAVGNDIWILFLSPLEMFA